MQEAGLTGITRAHGSGKGSLHRATATGRLGGTLDLFGAGALLGSLIGSLIGRRKGQHPDV